MIADLDREIFAASKKLIQSRQQAVRTLLGDETNIAPSKVQMAAHHAWRIATELALLGDSSEAKQWEAFRDELRSFEDAGLPADRLSILSGKFGPLYA